MPFYGSALSFFTKKKKREQLSFHCYGVVVRRDSDNSISSFKLSHAILTTAGRKTTIH